MFFRSVELQTVELCKNSTVWWSIFPIVLSVRIEIIPIFATLYKNPEFLFFDEATSSLDANTEKAILNNLTDFFKGRTVVVVAHRLSTVKNADQIIVIDRGKISQQGTHDELIKQAGIYADFVGMREKAIGWKIKADSLA